MFKKLNPYLLVYFFVPIMVINFIIPLAGEKLHTYLAKSFLDKSLSLTETPPSFADSSFYSGKYYLPLGPLPAVILMPPVALFGLKFHESYLKIAAIPITFWLTYKIAKSLKLSTDKSLTLAIFFVFGSVFTPLAAIPFSTYFTQFVACFFLLAAIWEFLNKRRPLAIGIFLSLAILTRPTMLLASIFFLPFLLLKLNKKNIALFIIPIISAVLVLGIYNKVRFGSFFESGYHFQVIPKEIKDRRDIGLFSISHIPANLYYLFLATPIPVWQNENEILKFPFIRFDPSGMSLFILSPVLILLFWANFKDKLTKVSLITTAIMLLPIITYFGIGYRQIGYRYALDFLPFLYLVLVQVSQKISTRTLMLLTAIGVFAVWFFIFEFMTGF